jgi:hypothetical protein
MIIIIIITTIIFMVVVFVVVAVVVVVAAAAVWYSISHCMIYMQHSKNREFLKAAPPLASSKAWEDGYVRYS